MARPFIRQIGLVPYVASSVQQIDLPRNHVIKQILLELTGLFTVAGGTTSGTPWDENPQSLLRSIRIVRNGSEVLQDLDGGTMFEVARVDWGTPCSQLAIASGNVQTNTAFRVSIPVDFSAQGMRDPSMSLLRAVGLTSLTLQITFGNEQSVVAGGDRTQTLSSVQLRVMSVEIMDLTGTFADKILRPIDRNVTATDANMEVLLNTGPMYRRLFFKTTQSGTGGVQESDNIDTVVNSFRFVVDGVLYLADRFTWNTQRDHNKVQYGCEVWPVGYTVLDFAEDGNPQGLLVTAGASEVKALFDVTTSAGARLKIVPEVYIPAPSNTGQAV